jgi:heavy metal sensor kinase
MELPWRVRTFRTRLALHSMLVSGLVVLAFGVPAWFLIGRIDLQRIDTEVRAHALPHLQWFPDGRHWRSLEEALRYAFGATDEGSVALLVKSTDGQVTVASPHWPKSLAPEYFPAPGDDEGAMVVHDAPPPPPGMSPKGPPRPTRVRRPRSYSRRSDGRLWRVGVMGGQHSTVVVAVDLAPHVAQMRRFALAFALALPLALALAAVGGRVVSDRALRPLRTLTRTAAAIGVRDLDQRIEAEGEDQEFARLITVFNAMLQRLQRSFSQAVRFSADAAHELKTPLTILQGELEQAVQDAEIGSHQQQVYTGLLGEVQRLRTIIRKLLLLSLADAGRLDLNLKPMDLTAAMEPVIEDIEALAPHLQLHPELAADVWVRADAGLLEQVLQNLASNAVKYNSPEGSVVLRLDTDEKTAQLTVINTGGEIPPEDRERVFDRFYRADKARSRRVDGTGLGLSLAREIARAHFGDLAVVDAGPGESAFRLTLPLAPKGNDR